MARSEQSNYTEQPGYRRMQRRTLRAARANRVFYTDEKHIRIEDTVIDKDKVGSGLIFRKIAD